MSLLKRFVVTLHFLFLLFACFGGGSLMAQDSEGLLNKLLAPGPLMGGHKELEGDGCLACHEGGKGVPSAKCLDCHKEIRRYVEQKKGFHGLHTQTCRECHADHKGRDYDSVWVDTKKFDHDKTGYKLEGKHAEIKCVDCHTEKRKKKYLRPNDTRWLGLATTCVSCHKKDDVHFFKAPYNKKDCNACHGVKAWNQDTKFDHEKDAKYKLEGKHAELKCAECHAPGKKPLPQNAVYKWPKLKTDYCMACHENYHANTMSKKYQTGKCNDCHTQTSFKVDKFDHSITGYELRERHAEIKCIDCHKQKVPTLETKDKTFIFKGLKTDCLSCHKDFHLFADHKSERYAKPNDCMQCHNERDWKQIHDFVHNKNTRYVIDGKHEELKCTECHVPQLHKTPPEPVQKGQYFWELLDSKTCENCHKSPHEQEFTPEFRAKQCTECHVTTGWKDQVTGQKFNHDKTRFKLTGKHEEIKCADCHVIDGKQVFKFKSFKQNFCQDCHENVHKKQFNTKFSAKACSECHTTKNFTEQKPFDHDLTSFPLKGEHQKVKCQECHKPTGERFSPESKSIRNQYLFPNVKKDGCISCHADYHKGQLSKNCTECHNEKGWKPSSFDHNRQSQFRLRGAHKEVECQECHRPIKGEKVEYKQRMHKVIRYKPLGMDCVSCHEDVHKGRMGQTCTDCHSERDWKITRDFHKNFTLSGVHYTLSCTECHVDQRKLAGMSSNCLACHQRDDVHNGTLPNCADCHRQQFWENAEFKHSMSQFPLRGAHRTLDCIECHSRGIYQGTPTACVSCHLQDALAVTNPNHSGFSNLSTCTDCHKNQFSFSGQ